VSFLQSSSAPSPPNSRNATSTIHVCGMSSRTKRNPESATPISRMTPPIVGTWDFARRFSSTWPLPVGL
jgi:hypothetical protein